MTLTERFLKAKHWQLFILTFGVLFIFQIILMVTMFANMAEGSDTNPSFMFEYMIYFPVIIVIFITVIFGWFWAIATGMQHKVPVNVKMNTRKFKVFFFIPLIYMLLVSIAIGIAISNFPFIIDKGFQPTDGLLIGLGIVILLLHLFSMFCVFYTLYFVAKTLKTVELQRETSFSDFAGEFFMIWLYPFGIWFIQPRVNKMVEGER